MRGRHRCMLSKAHTNGISDHRLGQSQNYCMCPQRGQCQSVATGHEESLKQTEGETQVGLTLSPSSSCPNPQLLQGCRALRMRSSQASVLRSVNESAVLLQLRRCHASKTSACTGKAAQGFIHVWHQSSALRHHACPHSLAARPTGDTAAVAAAR